MFEKEAEENAKDIYIHHFDDSVIYPNVLKVITVAVQKGAEFGYKKANEWHYVKDKKPKDNEYVLIYTDIKNVYIARLVKDDYFITNKGGFVQMSAVIAWKEIVLPELKESE